MLNKTYLMAVAGLAMAAPALAGDFAFSFSYGQGHRGPAIGVGVTVGRPAPVLAVPAPVVAVPAPVVVPAVPVQRIWVPPVYQNVTERVWVPTLQTAYRDVPVVDVFGNVVSYRREAYTIEGGYWSEVPQQVLVREGYWTTQPVVRSVPIGPRHDRNDGYERRPAPRDHYERGIRGPAPAPRDYRADARRGNHVTKTAFERFGEIN